MNMNVIIGLAELFTYWCAIYAAAGMWWINLTVTFQAWFGRQEF